MTTPPRLTIKVNGVPVSSGEATAPSGDAKDHLYMFYFQSVKDEHRNQWIVFPPPAEELLPKYSSTRDRQLTLSRTQTFAGNRSRWSPSYVYSPDTLNTIVTDLVARGHEVGGLLVVPLGLDDMAEAYDLATPQKALRSIDRLLGAVYNTSIK